MLWNYHDEWPEVGFPSLHLPLPPVPAGASLVFPVQTGVAHRHLTSVDLSLRFDY